MEMGKNGEKCINLYEIAIIDNFQRGVEEGVEVIFEYVCWSIKFGPK